MRHDHLKRELELMLLLAQNNRSTVKDLCDELGISRRSFYYFITFFKEAGFIVKKNGSYFRLDRTSPFFQRLLDATELTESDVLLVRQLLDDTPPDNARLRALRVKLDRLYDFNILQNEGLGERTEMMRRLIYDAIKHERRVEIIDYSSPHSHSVSNREVEPFAFMNNNREVACYELSTGKNKTFRLSRMGDVQIKPMEWQFRERHHRPQVDVFGFSGDELMNVTLLMGQLSHNVMVEEYPATETLFTRDVDGRWLLKVQVCSFLGLGRFVMGLYDDIEIVGSDGFRQYINAKVERWLAMTRK